MTTKVPFELLGDGSGYHLMINVKFNKSIDATLIIDTGASKTIFDKNLTSDFVNPISKEEFLSQFPQDNIKDKLPPEIAEHFEIEDDGMLTMGVDSKNIETNFAKVKSFKIGKLELIDYIMVLIDLSNVNMVFENITGKKIWGLLGSDFLVKHKAKIDYEKQVLTLKS